MKVALIGYGKMGKIIHQLGIKEGFEIVKIFDNKDDISSISNF